MENYPGSNFPQRQCFSEAIFLGGSCAGGRGGAIVWGSNFPGEQ